MIKVILKNGNMLSFMGHVTCTEMQNDEFLMDKRKYIEMSIHKDGLPNLVKTMGYDKDDIVLVEMI